MSTRSRGIFVSVFFLLVTAGVALAQGALPPAPAATVTGSTVLVTLFICGVFGLVGQGCRTIVGLITLATYKVGSQPNHQDVFNVARLLFSLIIGFIAGFVTGLTQWAASSGDITTALDVTHFSSLMKFAVAGYIGTDVIEAFTTQFFEPVKKSGTTQAANSTGQGVAPVKTSGPITASFLTASDKSVVAADDVISALKDVAVLKTSIGVGATAASATTALPIYGFDTEFYPTDPILGWLRMQAQLRVCVCYLANEPGKRNRSWMSKVDYLKANGWGLLPTYAGLQIHSNGLSAANGTHHGEEAAQFMTEAGFPPSTIVYLDLEDGTPPSGNYLAYIKAWVAAVTGKGFTPGFYCSHLIADNVRPISPIIWSFRIPAHTEGQSYHPDSLPPGAIDTHCIATQYRQKVNLVGLDIPATVDSEGLDLNVCAVADPSNYAAVSHALGL